ETAAQEKLLVGSWRAGTVAGKLTFRSDGTFIEFPDTLSGQLAGLADLGAYSFEPQANFQGAWRIANDQLLLTWKPRYTPMPEGNEGPKEIVSKLQIARLDPAFLRLTMVDSK